MYFIRREVLGLKKRCGELNIIPEIAIQKVNFDCNLVMEGEGGEGEGRKRGLVGIKFTVGLVIVNQIGLLRQHHHITSDILFSNPLSAYANSKLV